MYDDLRNFFVECLLADHNAFREAKSLKVAGLSIDLRLAIHACSSMLHMADHVFVELAGVDTSFVFASLGAYHNHLCSLASEFKIITDCANAHKHRRLSRNNPTFTSVTSIQEVVVVTEYRDDIGIYRIAEKKIHVKLSDGRILLIHECLDAVREMWWRELQKLRIIPMTMNDIPVTNEHFPPLREQKGETALLSLRLMRGERFEQIMLFQKFNYLTNAPEPLDLSETSIDSSIYQKSHGFDLKIKNRETSEESTFQVPVSDSEYEEIMSLQNDQEKQALMLSIARERGVLPEFIGDSDPINT